MFWSFDLLMSAEVQLAILSLSQMLNWHSLQLKVIYRGCIKVNICTESPMEFGVFGQFLFWEKFKSWGVDSQVTFDPIQYFLFVTIWSSFPPPSIDAAFKCRWCTFCDDNYKTRLSRINCKTFLTIRFFDAISIRKFIDDEAMHNYL